MPTGYTAPIYEGEKDFTFNKFVMRCARNFGAMMELRDEPLNSEVDFDKHFQPSDYHKKRLEQVEKEYQMFLDNPPTEDELGKRFDEKVKQSQDEYIERIKRSEMLLNRYEEMFKKVDEWEPPTSEHFTLKRFMINQLKESIEFDCNVYEPEEGTREEYIRFYMSPDYLLKEIAYHKEEYSEEVERCNQRKQWVMQLMDSLRKEE